MFGGYVGGLWGAEARATNVGGSLSQRTRKDGTPAVVITSANCGLILGTSTGAEIGDGFFGLEDGHRYGCSCGGGFAGYFFELLTHPADAGDFNSAVFANPEGGGDVG